MEPTNLIILLSIVVVGFLSALTFTTCQKRCPPNRALVVEGLGCGDGRVIKSSGIVLPVVHRSNEINLEVADIQLAARLRTNDSVHFDMRGYALCRPGADDQSLSAAAKMLANMDDEARIDVLRGLILESLADVSRRLKWAEFSGHYDSMADQACAIAQEDLRPYGIDGVSITIESIERIV